MRPAGFSLMKQAVLLQAMTEQISHFGATVRLLRQAAEFSVNYCRRSRRHVKMTFQFPKTPKQLTKAESLILDYVSNHTEAFLFSSIGQLAKQLGVSEATVSRC